MIPVTRSKSFFRLGLIAFLLYLPTGIAVADERAQEIVASSQRFVTQTSQVTIGRQTIQIGRGAFAFRPSLRFLHPPEGPRKTAGRRLVAISAEAEASFAYSDPIQSAGTWLRSGEITTRKIGKTAIEIRAIEIREDDRTIALIETGIILRSPRERHYFNLDERIEEWRSLRILYHIRLLMENDSGEIVPIPGLEAPERLIEWQPSAFGFDLYHARRIGRPPHPADLTSIGAGLVVLPGEVALGETFTAQIIFQNRGDLPSSPFPAQWRYGMTTLDETIPTVPPGATVTCRFSHLAEQNDDQVELFFGARRFEASFTPLALPRLALINARLRPSHADEPLEIELEIENTGHGPTTSATLRLDDGDGRETVIPLAPIASGERATRIARWDAELGASFRLDLRLASGAGDESESLLAVERRHRPRPRIAIERLAFAAEDRAGAPLVLAAALRNSGEIEGTVSLRLAIVHRTSGETLHEQSWSGRIAADSRVEIASEAIPREPGLLHGLARLENGDEEFTIIDLPPRAAPEEDNKIRRSFVRIDRAEGRFMVRRIERGMTWSVAPLKDLEEIDSSPLLVLSLRSWRRAATGAWTSTLGRENRPIARLTLGDGASRERFDLDGGETSFRLAIPRALLSETLALRLEPIGEANVFLVGTPSLILTPTAPENGVIVEARERGGAIQARIANRGRLIAADAITLSAATDGAEYLRLTIPLQPGAETFVRIPPPPGTPGRRTAILSLPRSVVTGARTLTVLTPPDPLPEFWASAPRWASTSGVEADFTLLAIEVATADAPGMALDALPETGAPIASLRLRLAVPAGETALFVAPPSARLRLDYGPMTIERRVPPRPVASAGRQLRIIDLGGDTPASDRQIVLRYERRGLDRAIPAGTVKLAVNGLLRAAQTVPALETGQIFIGGFVFLPGPAEEERLDLLLFEDVTETLAALSLHSLATTAASAAPTRVERGWIAPVVLDARRAHATETGSVYLRLAERAWEVGGFLMRRGGAIMPPLTPDAARRLEVHATETGAMARIAYREALDTLHREWRTAAILLGAAPLPVTVETRHLAALFAAIDRLETLAADPVVIDRGKVEETLERMTRPIDLLLGRIVE
jgi:hypothetical protein